VLPRTLQVIQVHPLRQHPREIVPRRVGLPHNDPRCGACCLERLDVPPQRRASSHHRRARPHTPGRRAEATQRSSH
jgi:hypothetical protein